MDSVVLVFSLLAFICAAASVVVTIIYSKKSTIEKKDVQDICDTMQDTMMKDLIKDNESSVKQLQSRLDGISNTFTGAITPYMDKFDQKLETLTSKVNEELKESREGIYRFLNEQRESNEKQMKELQASNEKKLDEMKSVVDEKLTSTLDKRLNEAFNQIVENLAQVQKSFGEMRKLSEQVDTLNRTFTNVKTRGTWGEASLESLLEEILAPQQYESQYKIQKGDVVDFVIKMPGKNEKDVTLLPIDSKFPIESYLRLVNASEKGTKDEEFIEKQNLAKDVREQAKSISQKYIKTPLTTDFAVMYLPTEGLYSEIVKNDELLNEMRTKYKVIPCGPSVLAAMLNSLQVGFTTLKIQKSSGEIAKMLKVFQTDFDKFTTIIEKTREKAEDVVKSLEGANSRNELIKKRLGKVDTIALDVLDKETKEIGENLDGIE